MPPARCAPLVALLALAVAGSPAGPAAAATHDDLTAQRAATTATMQATDTAIDRLLTDLEQARTDTLAAHDHARQAAAHATAASQTRDDAEAAAAATAAAQYATSRHAQQQATAAAAAAHGPDRGRLITSLGTVTATLDALHTSRSITDATALSVHLAAIVAHQHDQVRVATGQAATASMDAAQAAATARSAAATLSIARQAATAATAAARRAGQAAAAAQDAQDQLDRQLAAAQRDRATLEAAISRIDQTIAELDTELDTGLGAATSSASQDRRWVARLPAAGRRWADPIIDVSGQVGIDPRLLAALVWTESGFRPHVTSHAGAHGLTQLMPGTADEVQVDRTDPHQNLLGGARYLAGMLHRYPARPDLALAAYNAGPGRVDRAGPAVPAIAETIAYVATVTDRYRQLAAG